MSARASTIARRQGSGRLASLLLLAAGGFYVAASSPPVQGVGRRVIQSVSRPDADGRWVVEVDHAFSHDGWVAARCFEPAGRTIRFAHTSPIYVNLGRPASAADDAKFFLAWIDREIGFYTTATGFRDPSHREEMLEFFRTARSVYARLAR